MLETKCEVTNMFSHLAEHRCSVEHGVGNTAIRVVVLWAVYPWLWPVSLRMLCVVGQNEIRQRRKLVDRALWCVCRAINVYAHGQTTIGKRSLATIEDWACVERPGIFYVGPV